MKIEFNNVRRKSQSHKKKLLRRFSSVIESGIFFNGREGRILNANLRNHIGPGYINLVASGHDGLLLALQAIGCTPKDEVIFPANVYPTAFPVALSGAKPVLVDVDRNGLMDLEKVKRAITSRTKAIIPVHLYGLVVDINKLKRIVRNTSITIIEDCAQAFGSLYKNKSVGTLGDIGCFSFYPTKNIGTLGDGGAVWTSKKKYASFLSSATAYGEKHRYKSEFISGHSRLPELQAATLNIYLDTFNEEKEKKRAVTGHYLESLKRIENHVRPLYQNGQSHPLMHLMVVEVSKRNTLQKYLHEHGIPTGIHYPHPVHKVKAFKHLKHTSAFPSTDKLAGSIMSLPFHSSILKNQIQFIVKTIETFYEKNT